MIPEDALATIVQEELSAIDKLGIGLTSELNWSYPGIRNFVVRLTIPDDEPVDEDEDGWPEYDTSDEDDRPQMIECFTYRIESSERWYGGKGTGKPSVGWSDLDDTQRSAILLALGNIWTRERIAAQEYVEDDAEDEDE